MIWIILIVLGAALIAGGIVAYRGSRRTGVRAFSAAGIAAGIVMWAIVVMIIPVSSSDNKSPSPTISPTGFEKFFEEIDGESDLNRIAEASQKYSVEFLEEPPA